MYKLIIEDDEGKTTRVPLVRDEFTIGRKEGNTIRLTERNVSRRHARLVKVNGAVYIEDLESFNGTRVNGERIAGRAAIAEGDRIQIGDYQLFLKLEQTATDPEPQKAERGDEKTIPFEKDQQSGATRVDGNSPTMPQPLIATPPVEEKAARLVVVSSNFAGLEFKLDQPSLQIGRTADNDLVINHRSISRHHATVAREQGRYHISDMGSANGVRVNGEDYGKVELRKGDLVDLGHVRLRFVAAGEDFVFARDAQVVDVDGASNRGKVFLVGGVVALLAVLAVVVVAKALSGKSGGEAGRAGDVDAQVTRLGSEVDTALKAQDWDGAIAKAAEGLKLDPKREALRGKQARAEKEKKNQLIYDEYSRSAKANQYEAAVTRYQELDADSVYHDKAQESWGIIRGAYIKEHLAKAHSLQSSGRCDEARKHVESVLFIDEANVEAQDVGRRCAPQAGGGAPRQHPSAPRAAATPKDTSGLTNPFAAPEPAPKSAPPVREATRERETPPPAPKEAPPSANVDALVGEAQDDYVHGSYQSAIEKARKANKGAGGSNAKAWRIIGASSCFLRDRGGAVSSWNKLGAMDRQFLKYVCQRNNISIP